MKRLWIGILVLSVLLSSGIGVSMLLFRTHRPIAKTLQQASHAAVSGNWQQATTQAQKAQMQWKKCRDLTAAFADHSVLEEVDSLFAQVQIYAAFGDVCSFSAACAHLSRLTQAIAESHLPKWQNFL